MKLQNNEVYHTVWIIKNFEDDSNSEMKIHTDNDNHHDHHHFHHHHHHPILPTKQHTTQPTRFNGYNPNNPNNLISEHHLVMVFFLRFGTWNWPLPPKDNFLQAKLNVGKYSFWKSHCKNMFGHLLLKMVLCEAQWCVAISHDGKKHILWHSTWFNNMLQWTCSHVRDTFCSPSRSVYRYS